MFDGAGRGGIDLLSRRRSRRLRHLWREIRQRLGGVSAAARRDGKAEDVFFRPDGNDEPGGVVACSEETGLRARGETAPIRLYALQRQRQRLQLYELDARGQTHVPGTIGDNMTSPILTYVDSPWMVADSSGKCLEIVLPGQRTRCIPSSAAGRSAGRRPPRRTTPQAGSEEMLRRYIEAIGAASRTMTA